MAISEGKVTADTDVKHEEAESSSRDSWLEMAASDVDSGLAALATAARHGRPLPRGDR